MQGQNSFFSAGGSNYVSAAARMSSYVSQALLSELQAASQLKLSSKGLFSFQLLVESSWIKGLGGSYTRTQPVKVDTIM